MTSRSRRQFLTYAGLGGLGFAGVIIWACTRQNGTDKPVSNTNSPSNTSKALSTPECLSSKPESIGQPVFGVRAKIAIDAQRVAGDGAIGRLCIRSAWSTNQKSWIETGDLAYRDPEGDIFLCGRVDDMVVSGGENVYPIKLENVLMQHPDIEAAVVVGIPDPEFGQRLKAVVVSKQNGAIDSAILLDWLKPRVARYQMPATIEFRDELSYTPLGKIDRKSVS
jgi:acyl-CoA synthetase (AMP-forming)/AMP-acid ligase II